MFFHMYGISFFLSHCHIEGKMHLKPLIFKGFECDRIFEKTSHSVTLTEILSHSA